MTIQILDLLVSTTGILMLGALWHLLWRPLVIAHLRQDLFDARDFLFDLVADEQTTLKFDSVVYRGTREDLNLMIRFSHSVSLATAFFADLFIPNGRKEYRARVSALRENLTDEERRIIQLVDRQQGRALMRFLLCSSPLMWLSVFFVGLYVTVFAFVRVLHGGLRVCRTIFKDTLFLPAIERVEFQSGQKYLFGYNEASAA